MGRSLWDMRFGQQQKKLTFDEALRLSGLAQDDSWKTINGARVLLGDDGTIKGGANGKFNGMRLEAFGRPSRERMQEHAQVLSSMRTHAYKSATNTINNNPETRNLPESSKQELIAKAATEEFVGKFQEHLQQYEMSNPPKALSSPMNEQQATLYVGGYDVGTNSCVSVMTAFIANQELGLNVRDFRGGVSTYIEGFGTAAALTELSSSGYDTKKEGGGIYFSQPATTQEGCVEAFKALDSMKPNKNYVAALGAHAAIVRKLASGEIQYLELQGGAKVNGWKALAEPLGGSKEQREAAAYAVLRKRFVMLPYLKPFAHGVVPAERYANTNYIKEHLQYINTTGPKQQKI